MWVGDILKKTHSMKSDCTFGTIYIWSGVFNTRICNYKGSLIESYDLDRLKYAFPFTDGNLENTINFMIINHEKNCPDAPFTFTGVVDSERESLEKLFPNRFEFVPKREMWEYIYSCEELATLSGKKFHNKRNHVSKFKKLYVFEYEKINRENIKDIYVFIEEWFNINGCIESEKTAIYKCLDHYEELGLLGGVIKVNTKIIAFTIGEKINSDTFLIHFEKAFKSYSGAYSIINLEFSKILYTLGFKYINREEDLGIPGLRKAKLSYNPLMLIRKYDAIFKG